MAISFLLVLGFIPAQKKLPILNASSVNVAINDGGFLDKNAWTLSPEAKPDVYIADRSQKTKWVTFYTDQDSIRIKVKPGTKTDFVILLNGKDSCFTRVQSSYKPVLTKENRHDTIPFTLTAYNAIHVKAIVNKHDTLNLHFDLGSLDFRFTKEAFAKRANVSSTGGNKSDKIQIVQIGSLIWNNPEIKTAVQASKEMDGRFGWNVFDGKVVEIDYDKNYLVVHSAMPALKKGFVKSDIRFVKSFLCVEAGVFADGKKFKGNFLFDTGSDLALVLDSVWMSNKGFPKGMKPLKKSVFSDGAGRKYANAVVSLPKLLLNGVQVKNIPTSLLGYESPLGYQVNYFGNDLLKRFNTIIDLRKDKIYLKPNGLFNAAFQITKGA